MTPPGRVLGIAVKTAKRGPMRELTCAQAQRGGGLTEGPATSARRGLTLLAREQWAQAEAELNTSLPWLLRRANLLVEGVDLARLIGGRIRCGGAEVLIHGETTPCALMDQQQPGLLAALRPFGRAGVYGEVVEAGPIAVGDAVVVLSLPEMLPPDGLTHPGAGA